MRNKKIMARLLALCTAILLSLSGSLFNLNVSATQKTTYLGLATCRVKSDKVYKQGKFIVDGKFCFCIDYLFPTPLTGTPMHDAEPIKNESIRAILYYGYDGIENQVGTNDAAIVATSLALDSIVNPKDDPDRHLIPGYTLLMEHARKQDAPHGIELLDAIVYNPHDPKLQRLARRGVADPLAMYPFRLTVNYADRKDGRILRQQCKTEQKRLGEGYSHVAEKTCGENGDGTYKLVSQADFTGEFTGKNVTLTFYYDLWVPAKIEHRDARTGRLLDSFTGEKRRDDGFSYAPKRDLKAGKYTYRPVANDVFSGTATNQKIEKTFHYDVPLLELGLKNIQIHTQPRENGLEVKLNLSKNRTIYDDSVSDMSKAKVAVGVYDGSALIDKITCTLKELKTALSLRIPSQKLTDGQCKNYTAKIEGFNSTEVSILANSVALATEGHTSTKTKLPASSFNTTQLSYKGVVMTQRAVGQPMQKFFENYHVSWPKIARNHTGYGFEMCVKNTYTNDLGEKNDFKFCLNIPNSLMAVPNSYRDNFVPYSARNGQILVPLEKTLSRGQTEYHELQHVNVEQMTGNLFSDNQIFDPFRTLKHALIDGGRNFYCPIWADVGKYPTKLVSTKPIGVNRISVEIRDEIELFASMICHMNSPTKDLDAILWHPVDEDEWPRLLAEATEHHKIVHKFTQEEWDAL